MTTIAQNFVAKASVALVATALVISMFVPAAKAQTADELQTMINNLMAQIAALQAQVGQGGNSVASGVCPFTWTRDLTMGASGADVMKLQQFLNADADTRVSASGVGSVGMETEYFGALTAASVSKFQVMYRADILTPAGLVNPTGYFGPSSRAKANAICAVAPVVTPVGTSTESTSTPETPSTTLNGGEGSLTFDTLLDGAVSIDLGAADEALGVTVTAKDSDVAINRVDFHFDARPWLYFAKAELLVDGEVVSTLTKSSDYDEVTAGTDYRARFSGLDTILRQDDTANVSIRLTVLDSMAGTRDADTVNVSMDASAIRFDDGAGISSTDGSAINADVTFNSTFGDGSLSVTADDNTPTDDTMVLNDTTRTSAQTAAIFNVKAKGSDNNLTSIVANFTVSTGTVAADLYQAKLYAGDTLLKTKAVSANSVTFDNLDYKITKDDTQAFHVDVDFNRGDGLILPAVLSVGNIVVTGDTTDFTSVNDTVAMAADLNILVSGLVTKLNSVTSTVSDIGANSGNKLTINYSLDVTAYGADFYVSATGTTAISATIDGAGTTTVDSSAASVAGVTKTSNTYRIGEGTTKTLTISYIVTDTVGGYITGQLNTLTYGLSAGTPTGLTATLGSSKYALPTNAEVSPL